jgi:hypothetical protein
MFQKKIIVVVGRAIIPLTGIEPASSRSWELHFGSSPVGAPTGLELASSRSWETHAGSSPLVGCLGDWKNKWAIFPVCTCSGGIGGHVATFLGKFIAFYTTVGLLSYSFSTFNGRDTTTRKVVNVSRMENKFLICKCLSLILWAYHSDYRTVSREWALIGYCLFTLSWFGQFGQTMGTGH